MSHRLASVPSLMVAAVLGGLMSQVIDRWTVEAQAQEAKAQDETRVKRLVVVGEDGKPQLTLGALKHGHGMEVVGKDGKARVSILVFEEAGILQVWHKDGPDGPFEGSVTPVSLTVWGKGKEDGQRNSASIGVGGGKSQLVLVGNPSAVLKETDDKQVWKAP